jgi:DNA polymerase II large subunit
MQEKVRRQMELAEKIRAVETNDVARLVIDRHFIRDIKGNLRKFSQQEFRCSKCNTKYRRPPLTGKCLNCRGNIIFTIGEGFIIKYLEPALQLAEKYDVPPYIKQNLDLTKSYIESIFGRDKEKQESISKWF